MASAVGSAAAQTHTHRAPGPEGAARTGVLSHAPTLLGAAAGAGVGVTAAVAVRAARGSLPAMAAAMLVGGGALLGAGAVAGWRALSGMPLLPADEGAGADAPGGPTEGWGASDVADHEVFTVAQLNAGNLFDTEDGYGSDTIVDRDAYELKLSKLAHAIADDLEGPDVIAMQEVENQQVLDDLADHPKLARFGYRGVLIEGSDPRGIDCAILYRNNQVSVSDAWQAQQTGESDTGRPTRLFTRPPLVATIRPAGRADALAGAREVTLVVNHWVSKLNEGNDARRLEQARFVAELVQQQRDERPDVPVIVAGDLNAEEGEPAWNALRDADRGRLLVDATRDIPEEGRYTYRYRGQYSKLDHIMVTPDLDARVATSWIPHLNTDAGAADRRDPFTGRGSSDHDPVAVTFE